MGNHLRKPFTSRREALLRVCNGIGAMALAGTLAADTVDIADPLKPRPQHRPRKAKHCIFLFMVGGVSQMDSFENKPMLKKFAGGRIPKNPRVTGELAGFLEQPHRIVPSPFEFKAYGQSGKEVSSLFPHLGQRVDDMAFIHGIKVENNNHGPATMHVNTGSQLQGSPSVGSWISYGLGTTNQNLPAYVVLEDPRGAPVNGSAVWGNGYLPATFQGTTFKASGTPILDLESRGISRERQRQEFDLLKQINQLHSKEHPGATELEARINAYELAFRMQAEAPQVVDLSKETEATKKLYGFGDPITEPFGRQCLLARRLVQSGVRHILLTHGVEIGRHSWDDHGNIGERFPHHAAEVDKPVAALLEDLKKTGLLEETLVVWISEMGRTSFISDLNGDKPGRGHNQFGLVTWLAGGDVKGGVTHGATDDFSVMAAEEEIPLRNVHATILDLMGLDDKRLNYLHAGRFRKLTDIGGDPIRQVIA